MSIETEASGGAGSAVIFRVRHMLAVMRSMLSRSAEMQGEEVQDFAAHFDGRIEAFARTQMMLLHDPYRLFDLEDLLRDELVMQTASETQYELAGPEILLSAPVGGALTIAFHELATNATKFGALSHTRGKLEIGWRAASSSPSALVNLRWRETGVGRASAARKGFGMELLTRKMPYEMGGSVEVDFSDGEMICDLAFPLEMLPLEEKRR